jgi:hypothetical protein
MIFLASLVFFNLKFMGHCTGGCFISRMTRRCQSPGEQKEEEGKGT